MYERVDFGDCLKYKNNSRGWVIFLENLCIL